MTVQYLTLALYTAAAVVGFIWLDKHSSDKQPEKPLLILLCILSVALMIRVYCAFQDCAFWFDVNCFKSWADCTDYYGLKNMYSSDIFLDYPPGYMYVLALIKQIQLFFNLESSSLLYTFIIKLPAIITDLLSGLFVYKLAREHLNEKWSLFLCSAYLFAPAVIFNSSVWGQIDSFYTFFIVGALYFATKKKTVGASLMYAVALFTKPQALLFGPVLLFYILETRSVKEFFKAITVGLGSIYLMALPFTQGLNPLWLIDHYKSTFGGYRYFTVNAYNLFMALGLNWTGLDTHHGMGSINVIIIGIAVALCAWAFFKIKSKGKFFYIGYMLITIIFTFCTMMHERYLFPAFLLCLMGAIVMKEKRMFFLFIASQGLNYLNISACMHSQYRGFEVKPLLYTSISVGMVALCLYSIYVLVSLSLKGSHIDLKRPSSEKLVVLGLTVFYGAFAFFQLGNTKAPKTFYQSIDSDEWFIINFDTPSSVSEIYAYTGLGDENYPQGQPSQKIGVDFEILYQDQDNNWVSLGDLEKSYVFTWQKKSVDVYTDSVMVRANAPGQVLGEIVFLNEKSQIIQGQLELSRSDWGAYSPYLAVDESETVPYDTSYYSSMYFDEIYHGRTAYEQLNGQSIYETTHPPLGKVLIEIGIVIFGMTPFGWRFMGTLCGVLMVPVMYYLAKLLFKNKTVSLITAFIFAFDFMHYTQTRIATVDTFVVMFVMLTFLFMLKYHHTKLTDPLSVQWIYLLFSGIFMGCAMATKWNSAYSIMGLAIFFFASLFMRYCRALKPPLPAEENPTAANIFTQSDNVVGSNFIDSYEQNTMELANDAFKKRRDEVDSEVFEGKNSNITADLLGEKSAVACGDTIEFSIEQPMISSVKPSDAPLDTHRETSNPSALKKHLNKTVLKTIAFCFVAFIFVPFLIYFASYGSVLHSSGVKESLLEFWACQKNMFSYHSTLVAEHFFASPWYSWLFMKTPIWYSIERFPSGAVSSISAFGNPAVWWCIPFAILLVLWLSIKEKDEDGLFILAGYFASLLPWVFISRLTFIYHYFPATIFGVLAIGYILNKLYKKYPNKRKALFIYPLVVFLCFIIFFPVISGMPASGEYVNALELFPNWYFN
ncbi:MAG: glycosyltransferase family 39 protein [Oscillospiraceae bacterium]